jgi:anti-anti-sigma regulatory factor
MMMDFMGDGASLNLGYGEVEVGSGSQTAATPWIDQATAQSVGTVVLQPKQLDAVAGQEFMAQLQGALKQASVVLVDLIWIEHVSDAAISLLIHGMQLAQERGKTLSFLSMDSVTRQKLDAYWEADRVAATAHQDEAFAPDFEQFLANYQARKAATMIAMEMASSRQR